jgi:hypothetical protein
MDEIDEALRLADGLDLDDGQWIVDALAAEVRRLRSELATAERRIRQVLGLHRRADWGPNYCAECIAPHDDDVPYPCPTVRALEDPS